MAVTIGSVTEGNANAEEIKNNSPDSELYEKNKKYLQGSLVKFNDKIYLAKRNVPSDVDLDNPYYWEIFMDAADSKRVDELFEKTGNLDELETESKDNLVNAINEAVLYTAQSLTEEQQAQARANIGADLSTKMDANNPVGTGSFSMNRKAGTVVGVNSHAEGNDTTASGLFSHAEGCWATASGDSSHAEGYQTIASKNYSHAEGSYTTASGHSSHAEGSSTTAIGYHSHAEGNYSTASGFSSHAEGSYTKATSDGSHVQGKYNIEDTSSIYADIIGNGASATARSNAATVDWEGNAWFAGDVYTGSTSGTNKDEGSKKLATEEYVNNSIVPDTTLTQSGQAADAKTVGDRLDLFSEEIVATSESKVAAHNTGTDTHSDIRLLIQGLTDRLNALADSDDTTLDQLSEVVAYIKSNRSLIEAITTSKVSVADIIDNLTTNVANKPLSAAQGVALKALIDAISVPDKLPNPNALTFTGAATGSYDGSEPVTVEIPSGGGSSGGSGKAKSQILIDQEITELTASLSVTLEHDFHNLTAIISCGSAGAALTAGSDGTAVASKIGFLIDTTSFGHNPRKVAYIDTSTATWQTRMMGAEWSDDLSVFKRGFAVEISTGKAQQYFFPFGGTTAMYGTVETVDNVPRTGRTANIVVNGAYLNVGTRVILWGEYYE